MRKRETDEYTEEEAARRMLDAVQRSFTLPHKTAKDYKGTTPRAKAMARTRKRKAKASPKAK